MKLSIRAAVLALALVAGATAVAPQVAASAPPPPAAVTVAPAGLAADPSAQGTYYCDVIWYPGLGGGADYFCELNSVYLNAWLLCYNPVTGHYYYVGGYGWFGPYGWWFGWLRCGPDAYPVQLVFDVIHV